MQPAPNQFALLRTRRFLPLFLVQFLGAFNDQVYQKAFVALLTYRLADQLETPLAMLGVIASALFILPFAVVTPTAGQIADRMDKARMMKWVKAWEIVVMALAVVGFHTQNILFLYFVLFLMGAQSAMFAPVKYAVLPQYLRPGELMGGNGLVQAFTFLAIIFGSIAGNELILTDAGVTVVSVFVVAVAVVGFAASLFAPPAPPQGPAPAVDPVFPRAIWRLIADCRKVVPAFRAVRFIAWFWFLGATFLSLLPAYAREHLAADESVLTVLLTAFSVGVAIGALLSSRLNGGTVGIRVSPWGALGIAVLSVELWFATQAISPPADGALMSRGDFFADPAGWRILFDFAALAACAGLYVTPLNAILQVEAPEGRRARFIACSNVVDAAAMVASAGAVAVCVALGMTAADVLALFGLTGLLIAPLAARHAPGTAFGRVARRLLGAPGSGSGTASGAAPEGGA
jgi:MFS family permease